MSLPWSSKGVKATPVNADELMILDSADANPATVNKRITVGSLPVGSVSPLTTKGDLYTFDTGDQRLPVGADGQILVSDSVEATGLKWIVAPSTGVSSINGDPTPAQIMAAGTGLNIFDGGATHTYSIDGTVVTLTGVQILTNKTLTLPVISDFTNSVHDHSNTIGGGQLTNSALQIGVFSSITGVGTQSQNLDMGGFNIFDALYFESNATNPANIGAVRLGEGESIAWRDGSNTNDFFIDSNDPEIAFNGWTGIIFADATDVDFTNASLVGILNLTMNGPGGSLNMADAPATSFSTIQFTASNQAQAIALGNTEVISWEKNAGVGYAGISSLASDELVIGFSAASPGALVAAYTFNETQADFNIHPIVNSGGIGFTDNASLPLASTSYIQQNGTILTMNIPSAQSFSFTQNAIIKLGYNSTSGWDFQTEDIVNASFAIGNLVTTAFTYSDGVKQTFNPNATNAGLNVGLQADPDPTVPFNGDIYYNSTNNKFRAYENSVWVDMIASGGGSQTPWVSDIDGATFNLLNSGFLEQNEISEPATPAVNLVRIWSELDGGINLVKYKGNDGVVQSLLEDNLILGVNTTGVTITAGQAVRFTGASGNKISIGLARADVSATMPSIGVAATDILNNTFGPVLISGNVEDLNTSAFAAGDLLYVSETTAGALTDVAPSHPNLTQVMGVVVVDDVSVGEVTVNVGVVTGDEQGTNSNSFKIGDALAGAKTVDYVNTFTASLSWNPTAARTLTLPDTTDTIVGKVTTDILLNKTLDDATNIITGTFGITGLATQTQLLNMGNFTIEAVDTPVNGTDAANKTYVDNLVNGLSWKEPALLATTGNITLSGNQSIDGTVTINGDRILVKDQTSGQFNGVYTADAGAWTRTVDADTESDLLNMSIYISQGSTQADTAWVLTTDSPIVVDTTVLTYVQVGAGAGNPLTTKGDIFGYDTANARIPVGTDGQVLTANSAVALGVDWQTLAGTGDVVGPGSATDDAVSIFDGVTGKLIKNSTLIYQASTSQLQIPGAVVLTAAGTIPAGTNTYIREDGVNMDINVAAASSINLQFGGGGLDYVFTSGSVDFSANTLTNVVLSGNTTLADVDVTVASGLGAGITYGNGIKQTFNPSSSNAGLNVGQEALGGDPASPVEGDIYYNSTSDKFRAYENSTWVDMIGASPLTTKGDIFTFTTVDARLPVGTNGQVLSANSATATGLEWGAAGTGDVVGPGSATDTAIALFDGVTGKLLQNSTVTIDVDGDTVFPRSIQWAASATNPSAAVTYMQVTTGALRANVPTGNTFVWTINGASEMNLSPTGINFQDKNLTVGTGYIDLEEIATPANPVANVGRLYTKDVAAVTELFFRDSVGTETNLIAGGSGDVVGPGSSTDNAIAIFDGVTGKIIQQSGASAQPLVIDDTANLSGIRSTQFTVFNTVPGPSVEFIQVANSNMQFNVQTGFGFAWSINGASEYLYTATAMNFNRNDADQLGAVIFNISGALTGGLATDPYLEWDTGLTPDALRLNVPTSTEFIVSVNDVEEYTFSSSQFNGNGNTLTNFTQATLQSTAGPIAIIENTQSSPAPGTTTGNLRFRGDRVASSAFDYGRIEVIMGDTSAGSADGEMQLMVGNANTENVEYITLNESNTQTIHFKKNLQDFTMDPTTGTAEIIGIEGLRFTDDTTTLGAGLDFIQLTNNVQTLNVQTGNTFALTINAVNEYTFSPTALDVVGNDIDNIQNLIHDISTSGTDIDFTEDEMQTISIAANTVFTTANRAAGKSKVLKIITDGTLRTLTFPGWDWTSAIPANQAANKNGYLTLTCFSTTDASIVASYLVGSL